MCPDNSDRADKQIPDQSGEVKVVTTTSLPEAEPQLERAPNNEPHRQTLEDDLHSLLSVVRDSYKVKAPPERLKKVAEFLGAVRTIVSSLLLIGLGIILLGIMYAEMRRNAVQITVFGVPPDFDKEGYSSQVVASKLADKISNILEVARSRAERLQVTSTFYETLPDIEIPEAKVSLRSAVQYTKELLGANPTRIGGEIIKDTKGLYVTVRIIKNNRRGDVYSQTFGGPEDKLDRILDRAAEYVVRENDPYLLASYLYETGKTEKALELAQFCAYNKPAEDDAWAYILWGLILEEHNQDEEAVSKYEKAIEINPNAALAYVDWGLVLEKHKDYDGAVAKYKRAIKIDSKTALAYNNWGSVLLLQGHYDAAIAKFQEAIKVEPTLSLPYKTWAASLVEKGDYKGADAVYQTAVANNPKAADLYRSWGWALEQQNDPNGAVTKYQKAIETDPHYSMAYNDLGHALYKQQKYAEAIVNYQDAVESDAMNALAFENWGATLQAMGNQKEAISKFQRAIQISPQYSAAYNDMGYSLELLRNHNEAADNYRKATEFDPRNALAYFNLAYLLEQQKHYEQAVPNYQKVLELRNNGEIYDYAKAAVAKLQRRLK
jgi:tetratricopeptide (TPR) repeat protein